MDYEQSVWCILVLWFAWNSIGIVAPFFLKGVPWRVRLAASSSMLAASAKGTILLPIELLSPLVVPIALLFTKREDNELPKIFNWWDNDVSINGDLRNADGSLTHIPVEDDPAINARNYWAKGKNPRSFYSRFVWLGLRNRASKLSAILGYPLKKGSISTVWGDPKTSSSHDGWVLYEMNGAHQLYAHKAAFGVQFRYNWGFKLWASADDRVTAPVVNTTVSFKRRRT